MELILNRCYYGGGTIGTLTLNGNFICFMIEMPWKENAKNISCIPEGTYVLQHRYSQRFGNHLLVKNVAKRRCVLIRPGIHIHKELKGSLAPVSQLSGIATGVYSRVAIQKILAFYQLAKDRREEVLLTIQS